MSISEIDKAWAAGFFDGEGTIGIYVHDVYNYSVVSAVYDRREYLAKQLKSLKRRDF